MRWVLRIAIAGMFGLVGWAVWMRWETSIATTPAVPRVEEPRAVPTPSPLPRHEVPSPIVQPAKLPSDSAGTPPPSSPRAVRLDVPFVSQAPLRVWDFPYKEFCEEASVETLHLWKIGQSTPPADALDHALKEIQSWESEHLRTWEDTSAEETVRILREYFGHASARVISDVTMASMKAQLDAGRPFIVPARGRELQNPYFRSPGPLYHMLVVIGYDDATQEFITNDVGTNTKGAGLRYAYDDLYGAMGDWSPVDAAPTGGKVMIVVD